MALEARKCLLMKSGERFYLRVNRWALFAPKLGILCSYPERGGGEQCHSSQGSHTHPTPPWGLGYAPNFVFGEQVAPPVGRGRVHESRNVSAPSKQANQIIHS